MTTRSPERATPETGAPLDTPRISDTRTGDDPLCSLILAHRRLGVAAAGAAERVLEDAGPDTLRQLLSDLSEVALDAAARLADHGRSEGVAVRLALRRPVGVQSVQGPLREAGNRDGSERMLPTVWALLEEDLAHTALLAGVIDCETCSRMVGHDHEALRPFVEPIRRRLPSPAAGSGGGRPRVRA